MKTLAKNFIALVCAFVCTACSLQTTKQKLDAVSANQFENAADWFASLFS